MSPETCATTLSHGAVRRFWATRQQLLSRWPEAPVTPEMLADVIHQTGWVRTVGGVAAYVGLHARTGCEAADVDAACEAGVLHVVPAVRGCIYLVPTADVPAALGIASALTLRRMARDCEKVGVTEAELDTLEAAVLDALSAGPLTTHALRKALPDEAVRSLGPVGKKIGMTTPLPTALRRLELAGRLVRRLENKLDAERYVWAVPEAPITPLEGDAMLAAVAAHFFGAAGPATEDDFVTWSGLGKRDARAAMALADLESATIEPEDDSSGAGLDGTWFYRRADHDALVSAASSDSGAPSDRAALLPYNDFYIAAHGTAALTDPRFHERTVSTWGARKPSPLSSARLILQRLAVHRGHLVAAWDFDPAKQAVLTVPFAPDAPAALRESLTRAAGSVEALLKAHGHGLLFTMDNEAKQRARCEALRKKGPFQS